MKTYPLNEARAGFSGLMDKALSGEPCRVTRHGKDAVVIVSEAEWKARSKAAPTLGDLLGQYARAGILDAEATDRPWAERPLGEGLE